MKEFKISDSLRLELAEYKKDQAWCLKRGRVDNFGLFKVAKFIELSDKEARVLVSKIRQTLDNKIPRFHPYGLGNPDGPNDPDYPEKNKEGDK